MTEKKENALKMLRLSGGARWVPLAFDAMTTIVPSPLKEKPYSEKVSGTDGFGMHWIYDNSCRAWAPDLKQPPVVTDIEHWRKQVTFPDVDKVDWESAAAKDLIGIDREDQLLVVMVELGPFERVNNLLGFENAFYDMAAEPELYKDMIDAVADYKVRLFNKMLPAYKPDIVMAHDDLGSTHGPLISLSMYRELVRPAHRRIGEAIRSNGSVYWHHSCGMMAPFIGDLIENGAQIINPLQKINNWPAVAEQYGGKVCFSVGAEGRANYTDTTEEELRQDVREIIDIFAPTKGLFVETYVLNPDLSHNIDILCDEVNRYGKLPGNTSASY